MVTIIAGGRNYIFTQSDYKALDRLHSVISITEVTSGGATGADSCGQAWAIENNLPLKIMDADWSKHGKIAGFIRNQKMADFAEALIVFPGGEGTADMVKRAHKGGLVVFEAIKWQDQTNFVVRLTRLS